MCIGVGSEGYGLSGGEQSPATVHLSDQLPRRERGAENPHFGRLGRSGGQMAGKAVRRCYRQMER